MPSRRELLAGIAFFAAAALLLAGLVQPLGVAEGLALAACLGFVVLGSVALLRYDALAQRGSGIAPNPRPPPTVPAAEAAAAAGWEPPVADDREPTAEERRLVETTLAALEEAGALRRGEVEAATLWRATRHLDPGRPADVYTVLSAFSVLAEIGHPQPPRLTYVPVHTEYDEALIADVAAEILAALGHDVSAWTVAVRLPGDGSEGPAAIEFAVEGRIERVPFRFYWKRVPDELFPALARFARSDDPRELVCADCDFQYLLLAATRPGALAGLNRHFPEPDEMFGPP